MSNHSSIEHRANYHFVKVEEDFIAICLEGKASPHCKALILAILEQWTNTKRDAGEEPIIYMTYPQWIKATYWCHGRNVIIESLQELEEAGFISRQPYRMYGKDTFAYVLKVEAVQKAIKALPEKAPGDNLPSFNLNAFKNKRVPNQTRPKSNGNGIYNQTANAFNIERNIDTNTYPSNIASKVFDANAQTRALIATDVQEIELSRDEDKTPSGRIIAIRADVQVPETTLKGHVNGHHPDSGTRGLQHHSDGLHDSDGNGSEERRREDVATDRQRTVEEADATEGQLAQTSTVPPVLAVGQAANGAHAAPTFSPPPQGVQRGAGAKRTVRKPIATDEQPTPKCDTKEIQRRINEHRGYALEERGQIVQERIAVKTWCNLHELGEYDTVMERLKHDPYWGKTENYYRIGGVALLKETPKALAQPTPITSNKPAQSKYANHDLNMRKLEERKARLAANG